MSGCKPLLMTLLYFQVISVSPSFAEPDFDTGKALFLQRCKPCHGEDGNGKTFAANALNPPPRNFTAEQSRKELTQERMLRSVTQGRPGTAMMPWKDVLSEKEIQSVVHYIRREFMKLEN